MKMAIIGAGASGLIAAVSAKQLGCDFVLYEREARAGKKLLATGNGRCNLSNRILDPCRYHGDVAFANVALSSFGHEALVRFFDDIGIPITYEDSRAYPKGLQASGVLDMLRLAEGSCERCGEAVEHIQRKGNQYLLKTQAGTALYDKVIVCVGGKAAPNLSGGGSYALLEELGHKITPLKPSIVQLVCDHTRPLEGIKVEAAVSLGERCETGEVLFTGYGLSGPPILQLSRDAKGKVLSLDLAPDMTFDDLLNELLRRRRIDYLTAENFFTGFLNKKVGRELLKLGGVVPLSRPVRDIKEQEIKRLVSLLKGWRFFIKDTRGFDAAQVTAGGISCHDFYPDTMESRLARGVYAAGEVLNIDGDCGGFNLQWAFSSARAAVLSAMGGDSR